MKKILLIVVVAAVSGIVWFAVKRSAPPEIPFIRVKRETLVSTIQTNGKVEPLRMMAARAERAGIISKLYVEEGQRVSQGAIIAELTTDSSPGDLSAAKARIDAAQAEIESLQRGGRESELVAIENSLAEAKTQLETAQREAAALKRLASKQAATGEEVAKAERAVQTAQLQVEALDKKRAALVSASDVKAAEARLRLAQTEAAQAERNMGQRAIRAGINGVIYNLEARAGSFVEQGALIAEIGQLERVRVIIYVDEPDLGRVSAAMPVVITWDAIPGREWQGVIERVATSVIKLGARQVGEVIGMIDNPNMELVPEANVNVEIRSRVAENVFTVPKEALRRVGDKSGVYVLNGDVVQWRPVELGASNITRAELTKGLKEGEAVAVSSTAQLADGMRVKPVFE